MNVFVITGSTQGIGLGLAQYVLRRGDRVVVSGRSANSVAQTVARLAQGDAQGRVLGVAADVTRLDQVEALWTQAVAAFGRVDVWINNAGVAHTTHAIVDTPEAKLRAMVTTNLLGTMHGSQVAARKMVEQAGMGQGGGRIFNVLGGGSDGEYFPGMGIYGATKRGLDYFTRALVRELKGTPVLVGRVRPGIVISAGVVREIQADPQSFARSRKFMNVLADLPETVAPYLVEQMLAMNKSGAKIAWLSGGKIARRMLMSRFKPRADLFETVGL